MNNSGENETGIVDAEFEVAADATKGLQGGSALIVAEVNAIRSMAVAKPRDEMAIADKIKKTLTSLPRMALKMRYCKPVGWKTFATCECGREFEAAGWQLFWNDRHKGKACPKCNQKSYKSLRHEQQFARGLSVKAAEYLATEIMYTRTDVGVERLDPDTYKVTAKFFDVQTGRYNSREGIVSRLKKKWGGQVEREDDERFFGLTVPSAQSKLLREMVNRAIPFVIRHVLEETVDEACEKSLTDEEIVSIINGFRKFHITEKDLEDLLGVEKDHWTQEEYKRCREMYQSLFNKETSREELLAAITAAAAISAMRATLSTCSTAHRPSNRRSVRPRSSA